MSRSLSGLNVHWNISLDLAVTARQSADATVIRPFGVDWQQNLYLATARHIRTETPQIIEEIIEMCREWLPKNELPSITVFNEKGVIHNSIAPLLIQRLAEEELVVNVQSIRMPGDKQAKARVLQGRLQLGRVFYEDSPFFNGPMLAEYLGFGGGGAHDDIVDADALAAYVMQEGLVPLPPEVPENAPGEDEHALTYEEMRRRCRPRAQETRRHVPAHIDGRKRKPKKDKDAMRDRGLFFTGEEEDIE